MAHKETVSAELPLCGLIMPISAIDGCPEGHWSDVREILEQAVVLAEFRPNLVSNADDVGIIQKTIIQNLYDNPIVICDVSGKNPNVMFELGVRLAFDKPTIIVKDDNTPYSFDTAPIEHLEYPRDLRYSSIVAFKQRLAEKVRATHARAATDENYTTFLKNFGEFTIAKIEKKEVSEQQFVIEELRALRSLVLRLGGERVAAMTGDVDRGRRRSRDHADIDICFGQVEAAAFSARDEVRDAVGVARAVVDELGANHYHLLVEMAPGFEGDASLLEHDLREKGRRAKGMRRPPPGSPASPPERSVDPPP